MRKHSVHIVRSLKMCIRMLVFSEVLMKKIRDLTGYFSKGELILWCSSVTLIVISFLAFDRGNYLTLAASVTGATALILCAKGNPIGQALIVIFSIMYGIISYSFSYYGEMMTYLGMSAPMAVLALISWIKNPYEGNRAEVKVNSVGKGEITVMLVLAAAVTVIFYFILEFFGTANLITSTFSVTTSFIAVYLTFRRSPYYALAYASNDLVLIILWTYAAHFDSSYVSVAVCFVMFFVNDLYGFVNWLRMQRRQNSNI